VELEVEELDHDRPSNNDSRFEHNSTQRYERRPTVVELEDAGSLIGTSRKVAGLGEITGTQACERRIKSNGSRHLRRTRKHSGGRRLKQEFLGDFEVGNGDFASWRRRSERWRLRRIYSLLAKVQLRFVEAGWKWHWWQRADHNHSFIQQTTSNQHSFCAAQ
jgi:hypothetical protein